MQFSRATVPAVPRVPFEGSMVRGRSSSHCPLNVLSGAVAPLLAVSRSRDTWGEGICSGGKCELTQKAMMDGQCQGYLLMFGFDPSTENDVQLWNSAQRSIVLILSICLNYFRGRSNPLHITVPLASKARAVQGTLYEM